MRSLATWCVLVLIVARASAAPSADRITSLPGLDPAAPWREYSGYLQASGTRKLHYWFIESANNAKTDPVALWMNGGPGCSSLYGLLGENGPYRVKEDGVTLEYNSQSWNKIASMLYLEAPAGVGFSYSNDRNYTTNDDQVAQDNYLAIKDFFRKFPEYRENEFYVTGESYAGVYVPMLSVMILDDPTINFQGYLLGNGVSNQELLGDSRIYFAYHHGLIGKEEWQSLLKVCCDGDGTDCKFIAKSMTSQACYDQANRINEIFDGGSFDAYNLYNPCSGGVNTKSGMGRRPALFHFASDIPPPRGVQTQRVSRRLYEHECTNNTAVTIYTNLPEVRAALHIPPSVQKWQNCNDYGSNWYTKIYDKDMSRFYFRLLNSGKRGLLYNGDVDTVCNFLGDEWFVAGLGRKPLKARGMWYYSDAKGQRQVAGFAQPYDGITYITVRGSGHMVPTDRPRPALALFTHFIKNIPFL